MKFNTLLNLINIRLKYLIITFIIINLNSCILFNNKNDNNNNISILYTNNKNLNNWNIIGKINITNNNKSNTFNINWLQTNNNFNINITNILGFKVMQITGDNNQVVLNIMADVPEKGIYTSDSIHNLVLNKFNLDIPFDNLLYWIRGIQNPNQNFTAQFNDINIINHLNQDNYIIEYKSYEITNNKYYLPYKFKLINDKKNTINFVIKSWQI